MDDFPGKEQYKKTKTKEHVLTYYSHQLQLAKLDTEFGLCSYDEGLSVMQQP